MPTLQFKGRNVIWNHHLSVPYHTLDDVRTLDVNAKRADGNLLIEGDNLAALKALLPLYSGKIDCIYIDPPYNTGNEGWVYNDKVNSPVIQDWLGKVVAKDDLTRHDKWLCTMVPRLTLLRELLSDDGSLFVSIDDVEVFHLRCLLNEIFGEQNFVAEIVVHANPKGRVLDRHFSKSHEYILAYTKDYLKADLTIEKTDEEIASQYTEEDDNGKFRALELRNTHREFGKHNRPNLSYPFYVSVDLKKISLSSFRGSTKVLPDWEDGYKGCWTWGKDKVDAEMKKLIARCVGEKTKIFRKAYSDDENDERVRKKLKTIWYDNEFNTEKGQREVDSLLGGRLFQSPKPIELVKTCIKVSSSSESIVLDSFAGSGTTAHAVLDLNKEDGGNRKFILVQMTEATPEEPEKNICKNITRERIKRAIAELSLDVGFKYLRVGTPLDPESLLSGNLPTFAQFAEYVFHLCTGEIILERRKISEDDYFVGYHGSLAVYLIYRSDVEELGRLALNLQLAEKFRKSNPNKRLVVYAPACFLSEEDLEELQIDFVGIPYSLFQRNK
ncbi:MAG: site-specific DNA-methyltransferase [Ignavibacteriales bacterium]|nr:site-specific DNA-methyltransferase [Ignavibacteriales bacterium]